MLITKLSQIWVAFASFSEEGRRFMGIECCETWSEYRQSEVHPDKRDKNLSFRDH